MSQEIEVVGIVGAGFMGSGIAESCARAGLQVVVHEPAGDALERSRRRIDESLERAVRGGKLDEDGAHDLRERIAWSAHRRALHDSDLVVEAIVEDEAAKLELFRTLDEELPDHVLLSSNTSSIPTAGLAAATSRPDRVRGLDFFSRVLVTKLGFAGDAD